MLGSLNRYHPSFSISVIDDVLENITLGLESNDFKYNQRRLADVRYLGELYVYRMIDSSIIFDTMFKILTFGHGKCASILEPGGVFLTSLVSIKGGWPKPDAFCAIDPPDNYFRIRLVCSMLETCGPYYDKGTAKKKLDFFLTFFQVKIRTNALESL